MPQLSGRPLFDAIKLYAQAELNSPEDAILNTSWAVWADPGPTGFTSRSDPRFPGEEIAAEQAHLNALVLGLNPGNDIERGDWSNFHHSWVSRDQLLAEACRGTRLWGALMTDLYADQHQGDPRRVDKADSTSARGAERVLELLSLARVRRTVVVCLGNEAHAGFQKGLSQIPKADHHPELVVVRVPHYSAANAGRHKHDPQTYRRLVHAGLTAAGLADDLGLDAQRPEGEVGRD